jgi:hypothetical protein
MKMLPSTVSISRTTAMYPSFIPVPNHAGAGSVSTTGDHISAPHVKKRKCSSAWIELWCSAAW